MGREVMDHAGTARRPQPGGEEARQNEDATGERRDGVGTVPATMHGRFKGSPAHAAAYARRLAARRGRGAGGGGGGVDATTSGNERDRAETDGTTRTSDGRVVDVRDEEDEMRVETWQQAVDREAKERRDAELNEGRVTEVREAFYNWIRVAHLDFERAVSILAQRIQQRPDATLTETPSIWSALGNGVLRVLGRFIPAALGRYGSSIEGGAELYATRAVPTGSSRVGNTAIGLGVGTLSQGAITLRDGVLATGVGAALNATMVVGNMLEGMHAAEREVQTVATLDALTRILITQGSRAGDDWSHLIGVATPAQLEYLCTRYDTTHPMFPPAELYAELELLFAEAMRKVESGGDQIDAIHNMEARIRAGNTLGVKQYSEERWYEGKE